MRSATARIVFVGLALGLTLATLSGCGRKAGNLPPEDSTYPRTYPAPTPSGGTSPASTLPPPSTIDDGRRVTGPPS